MITKVALKYSWKMLRAVNIWQLAQFPFCSCICIAASIQYRLTRVQPLTQPHTLPLLFANYTI